jgi:hypothetical protein
MSQALSNIGSFLGSGAGKGLLTGGTLGAGLLQNLMAERQANAKQKFVQDLITNPEKFNALVARTERPLSQGLVQDISRQTDAYGAERGLGSSPYIMKDVLAQSLAPAEMQQQQMAINSLLSRLGTYAAQPTMAPVNVAPILQALSMWKPNAPGQWSPGNPVDPTNPMSMGGPMTLPALTVDTGTFSDFGTMPGLTDLGGTAVG